ncbi:MAG: RagB/SusD family nutrient uptake outer membrane protein [Paraprevotella sp.]|nr:RagB/SusD family nutrient uptake outer membrane protein [Paraprevotella sp.]
MAMITLFSGSLTSCGDFLDIYPLTMVYEDNYWNEKNDVDQIVNGCYTRMESDDFMRRLFMWGEVRSDNVGRGFHSDYSSSSAEGRILSENLLSTNTYTDWSPFYSVIDRCNLVIEKAPEVAQKDPSYLESDVNATIAEVTALRALCYFYLVRTFKDVPYYTNAITNDEQPLNLPATDGTVIIQNLINDLLKVYPNALTEWPRQSGQDVSYARITQNAIFAMLADMYLWIGDFNNAALYAQKVIDSKTTYFKNNYSSLYMVDGYPLIPDNDGTLIAKGTAYNLGFGTGGGPESIFELDFSSSTTDGSKSNTMVAYFFRSWFKYSDDITTNMGYFAPAEGLWTEFSSPTLFLSSQDSRIRESIYVDNITDASTPYINKYTAQNISFTSSDPTNSNYYTYRMSKNDANWIFYRVSDMMLIKAEALLYMMGDDMNTAYNDSLGREAFQLINAVADRSAVNTSSSLSYASYASRTLLISLLYDERRREFLFEGKRWFDLVRHTIRDGNNTSYLVNAISSKQTSSTATSKFGNYMAIYWPYNYDEVRVNDNLQQNPAYQDSENSSYESTK